MTSASRPAATAVTVGDPAGIGPDLVLSLPGTFPGQPLVALGDRDCLQQRADQLGMAVALRDWQPGQPVPADGLPVWHHPLARAATAGSPDPANARAVLATLENACDGCRDGTFAAMVTAPVSKQLICEGADPGFTGHTEFLAERAGAEQVVMMLVADTLRVALATTHLPLRDVSDAITEDRLTQVIQVLARDLERHLHIARPRILVLGLNPHAGEGGHLGDEELRVIAPTLERLRQGGLRLTGPVPADTAFTPALLEQHDAVLAMYHDQGLPVLKYAGFGEAVNVTLGLPFVRTSVDHGTAFALAGTGQAKAGSLIQATRLALSLASPGANL
ncbi:MAG: 4-hydroxythreonine-4-phosphate dehydrogenase PdxA [Alcanivoracaceae bacterium]